jgi:AcrR family transcriptional regulator
MTTERQIEILEAAIELIHKKGIQGLTIKNLANSIGVTEPAIYRHFENKVSILNAILDILKQDIGSILSKKLQPDASPLEKIEQMFSNHFEFFNMNPAVASVVFAEELFRNEPSLTKKIAEVIEQNNKAIVATITEGQQRKEIRSDISAENLSTMIMGTLRLFVKRWQLTGYGFDLTEEGKDVARMVKLLLKEK